MLSRSFPTLLATAALLALACPAEAADVPKRSMHCDGDPVCEVICNTHAFWEFRILCWVQSCADLCAHSPGPTGLP